MKDVTKRVVVGFFSTCLVKILQACFGSTNEPRPEKTNILHMRKQRRKSASR